MDGETFPGDETESRPLSSRGGLVGLSSEEAKRRLARDGPNEIRRDEPTPPWVILARQLESPVVWLLLGACLVSALLAEVADAVAIGAIVVLNAIVGFFQEFRAERAILALRSMTAPRARVLRDGHAAVIPASEVVAGDILLLEAGDVVAADAKVMEAHRLTVNEAPLTGESLPVDKSPAPSPPDAPLAERHDFVFMGTSVSHGTGAAQVAATGMRTELGHIAHLLATAQEEATPLQRRLARVTSVLLYISLGIVAVMAVAGALRGWTSFDVFMAAVSLAVAAVPEGLPAIVTIALAIGVQRMVVRHVLIRKLPAVETLGSVTVICTDKTGTLTAGSMAVRELWGPSHRRLLEAAAACCDAELSDDSRTGTGDPTEVAILVEAARHGIRREVIERERPRVWVQPFDPALKRMAVYRADERLYVKGAIEVLSSMSRPLEGIAEANAAMAARGLRVLAVAAGEGPEEKDLELLGLVGLADPPRPEVVDAIAAARSAGVKTVMITGDHPVTAAAIARELGIVKDGEPVDERVHARATPQEKIDVVREWKTRGEVVAMTGDGVNDAPALREAHVGIAMGRGGTEVTREAADIVLTDDNYASIVAAVEEGRGVFDNIRKTLVFVLTGNVGELAVMLVAALAGLPLPLLPLHLLWINLVTDGLPALALVSDPVDPDVMKKAPRGLKEPMLRRNEWGWILSIGLVEAALALGLFVWELDALGLEGARTLAFSTIVFSQIFRSVAERSRARIFWEVGPFTNLKLLSVVIASVLIQLLLHHVPAMRGLFQLADLPVQQLLVPLGLGLVPVSIVEVSKLLRRIRR